LEKLTTCIFSLSKRVRPIEVRGNLNVFGRSTFSYKTANSELNGTVTCKRLFNLFNITYIMVSPS